MLASASAGVALGAQAVTLGAVAAVCSQEYFQQRFHVRSRELTIVAAIRMSAEGRP